MTYLYLDTETTGLEVGVHEVWEIAYAFDDQKVQSAFVPHAGLVYDDIALQINRYTERGGGEFLKWDGPFESALIDRIEGLVESGEQVTLVGANPRFDAAHLANRWGDEPWHYRLLDLEAYAMGALGYDKPQSLKTVVAELRNLGYKITESDHTAANDVEAVRDAHKALQAMYEQLPLIYNNREKGNSK